DVPEAVLEPAEDTVVRLLLERARQRRSERTVHGGASLRRRLEHERIVDDAEFGNAVGEVARRLVAEREQPVFDEPQDILGPVAEIHDVPDVFDVDLVAEGGGEPVADQLEPAAERGGRRAVAAHADGNWTTHAVCPLRLSRMMRSDARISRSHPVWRADPLPLSLRILCDSRKSRTCD